MIVIVTGSRFWADALAIAMELTRVKPSCLVLGDCKRGVDPRAKLWAQMNDVPFEVLVADWSRGPRGGPERNGAMVKRGLELSKERGEPVMCLAMPMGESRGTRNCMRQAAAAGIPVDEVPWA